MSDAFDLRDLLAIAAGGGLGSVLRYVVAVLVTTRTGPGFPWGTLLINVSGSLAIGILAGLVQTRVVGAPLFVRLFFMVGVLGGYTTFSTFSLELVNLATARAPVLAFAYAVGSLVLGFAAAFAGTAVIRAMQL